MGADFSGIKTEEEFLRDYEETRRETDPNFGSFSIFKNKRNEKLQLMVKEKIVGSKDEVYALLSKCEARGKIKGQNVAPLVEVCCTPLKQLCSTSFRVLIGHEMHDYTLERLLRQRKTYTKQGAPTFSEDDCWGIFGDLTRGVRSFEERGVLHGDVQPCNVFVLGDKTLKLVDSCFINGQESAFARRYNELSYTAPLSPQAMACLPTGPSHATFSKEKNDVWAIGLTTLMTLNNDDYNICYDWPNQTVNFDMIKNRLKKVNDMGYSANLVKTMASCLERDENRRPTLSDLSKSISQRQTRSNYDSILVEKEPTPKQGVSSRATPSNSEGDRLDRLFSPRQQTRFDNPPPGTYRRPDAQPGYEEQRGRLPVEAVSNTNGRDMRGEEVAVKATPAFAIYTDPAPVKINSANSEYRGAGDSQIQRGIFGNGEQTKQPYLNQAEPTDPPKRGQFQANQHIERGYQTNHPSKPLQAQFQQASPPLQPSEQQTPRSFNFAQSSNRLPAQPEPTNRVSVPVEPPPTAYLPSKNNQSFHYLPQTPQSYQPRRLAEEGHQYRPNNLANWDSVSHGGRQTDQLALLKSYDGLPSSQQKRPSPSFVSFVPDRNLWPEDSRKRLN